MSRKASSSAGSDRTANADFLYDTLELERLAEQRFTWQATPLPNESYTHWGPRSRKMELGETDVWIRPTEAAHILGITRQRLFEIIREGKLPCYQKDPGKQGSPIFVPHNMVIRLRDNLGRKKNREAYLRGRAARSHRTKAGKTRESIPTRLPIRRLTPAETGASSTPRARPPPPRNQRGLRPLPPDLRQADRSPPHLAQSRVRPQMVVLQKGGRPQPPGADPEYIRHHKRYKKQFDKIWQDDPVPEPAAQPTPPSTTSWSWSDFRPAHLVAVRQQDSCAISR